MGVDRDGPGLPSHGPPDGRSATLVKNADEVPEIEADIELVNRDRRCAGIEPELGRAAAVLAYERRGEPGLLEQQRSSIHFERRKIDLRIRNGLIVGVQLRSAAAEESVGAAEVVDGSIVEERLAEPAARLTEYTTPLVFGCC